MNSVVRPMNFAATLLSASVFCAAYPTASAGEPKITTVKQGEPAPFDGDLYPVEDSIRLALALDDADARCAATLNHLRELQRIELDTAEKVAISSAQANNERLDALEWQLAEANVWYRDPAFVAVVTATVTVAAMLAATVLIEATGRVVP